MTTDAVLDVLRPVMEPDNLRPAGRRTARLLLVDAEPIVRYGLRQLLAADSQLLVVGEAATPRDALMIADRCPPSWSSSTSSWAARAVTEWTWPGCCWSDTAGCGCWC